MLRHALAACLTALLLIPAAARAHDATSPDHADTPADLAGVSLARAAARSAATTTGLPATWCGDRSTGDDVVDAAQSPTAPVVKVVYAYAAGDTDRSGVWSDALQANVATIGRFLAGQSGGGRSIGFDMGTRCGPQYVDIAVVALPSPRSAYTDDFDAIKAAVQAALPPATGPRNLLILADQLDGQGYTYGLGEVRRDERPGTDNTANRGGLVAALFSQPGTTPGASGWWPTGMLHEITHTLGAVQASAPHATDQGHCTDGYDVMCYADGGASAAPYSTTACPQVSGAIVQVYDCGRDDYYSPAPAPGSYLDTHWNVYRSAFMRPCTDLGDACAGTVRQLAPPASAAAPELAGTPRPGATLTTTMGGWTGSPTSYAVRWQHEVAPGVWADLPAAGPELTVSAGDLGLRLRSVVIAGNADGSAAAASAPSDPVVAPVPPLTTPAALVPAAPVAPTAATTARAPGALAITLRRGARTIGTLAATVRGTGRGVEIRTAAGRVRAGAGRWRLKLCATPAGRSPRCVLGPRARSAGGTVRVAAARLVLATATRPVRIDATLLDAHARTGARGRAVAR